MSLLLHVKSSGMHEFFFFFFFFRRRRLCADHVDLARPALS